MKCSLQQTVFIISTVFPDKSNSREIRKKLRIPSPQLRETFISRNYIFFYRGIFFMSTSVSHRNRTIK